MVGQPSTSLKLDYAQKETDMKQHIQILNHLRATKGLTVREAMIDYSIQSFTKRISELRSMGHRIDGVKGKHPVTGQRYTRYVLVEGSQPEGDLVPDGRETVNN